MSEHVYIFQMRLKVRYSDLQFSKSRDTLDSQNGMYLCQELSEWKKRAAGLL